MQNRIPLIVVVILFHTISFAQSNDNPTYSGICETVKFPGGDTAFLSFVYTNLDAEILKKYPDLKGTVYMGFVVDTTGKIISTEIKANKLNIPDSSKIIKEIRRVLQTSLNWEFYDLVKEDHYHDEFENDEIIVDDNLPVDEKNFKIDSDKKNIEKCKKRKVSLVYPFKFPIPKMYLEPKK